MGWAWSPPCPGRTARVGRTSDLRPRASLVFAVIFVLGFVLLDQVPKADATDADLDEFYTGSGSQVLVVAAFYIVPFAGIAFLWFLGALRHRVDHLAGT
jgi:hypothetical protein